MTGRWQRSVYCLILATAVAAVYLYSTLTAWNRFMFTSALYDPNLGLVKELVQEVLLCSGGVVFGFIAGRMRPEDWRAQMIVPAVIAVLLLIPFGMIEGGLLLIVPVFGTALVLFGVYVGRVIARNLTL